VLVAEEAPAARSTEHPLSLEIKLLERAYFSGGAERDGQTNAPYISTSKLRQFLEVSLAWNARKIENALNLDMASGMMRKLVTAGVVDTVKNGFIVVDGGQTAGWITS
jgi:hypothetical protein